MKIIRDKANSDKFRVESESENGKFYTVNIAQPFCDCPRFMFHEIKVKGECKHIKAAREYAGRSHEENKNAGKKAKKAENRFEKIINLVKEKGELSSMELIGKFSEEEVNELIRRGELLEEHGKIRLL